MNNQNSLYSVPQSHLVADKAALRRILEMQDKQTGFVVDATATPQKARDLMIAQGIRPEDNAFSREIKRSRDGDQARRAVMFA